MAWLSTGYEWVTWFIDSFTYSVWLHLIISRYIFFLFNSINYTKKMYREIGSGFQRWTFQLLLVPKLPPLPQIPTTLTARFKNYYRVRHSSIRLKTDYFKFEVPNYFTADRQSVSMSWYRAPLCYLLPDITSCRKVAVWNLRSCIYGAPSLTRGRVCNLRCNHSVVRVAQNP
jgi:hypothetical protein